MDRNPKNYSRKTERYQSDVADEMRGHCARGTRVRKSREGAMPSLR
jgi:hypothetical protein